MDFSIDMLKVGDADAFIIWIKDDGRDYIIFLDGGNSGNGQEVIDHYNRYIHDHLSINRTIYVINSHPHNDHINGLFEIVEYFKGEISVAIYNNPMAYVSDQHFEEIRRDAEKRNPDPDVVHLYESLKKMQSFEELLARYEIPISPAFSNIDYGGLFKIVGPSQVYYESLVGHFTNLDVLLNESFAPESKNEINEVAEGVKPCQVVDERNDASPENLSSVILQLTDNLNRKYLFTADAGVDSFESAKVNGHKMDGFRFVQLPHHGSRRNINTNWICHLSPDQYWVSAAGNVKHPRKAVIECIKKNLPNCKIYSTHRSGTTHINSTAGLFPNRWWGPAEPL